MWRICESDRGEPEAQEVLDEDVWGPDEVEGKEEFQLYHTGPLNKQTFPKVLEPGEKETTIFIDEIGIDFRGVHRETD